MKTEKFSERLRQALDERQMTAEQVRLHCGIGKATMSEYLSGQYTAKSERLEKLAQALECDPKWLEGYDVPMQPDAEKHGSCQLDIFEQISPDGTGEVIGSRSAPPEFCDGRHFWLSISNNGVQELLLCRRQGVLLGGQTGIYIDAQGEMLMLRCEHRRNATCFVEPDGKGRVFINEETEELRAAARVLQSVRDW